MVRHFKSISLWSALLKGPPFVGSSGFTASAKALKLILLFELLLQRDSCVDAILEWFSPLLNSLYEWQVLVQISERGLNVHIFDFEFAIYQSVVRSKTDLLILLWSQCCSLGIATFNCPKQLTFTQVLVFNIILLIEILLSRVLQCVISAGLWS